jgi:hypothetical protein
MQGKVFEAIKLTKTNLPKNEIKFEWKPGAKMLRISLKGVTPTGNRYSQAKLGHFFHALWVRLNSGQERCVCMRVCV